jgi:hypothetical protein
MIQKNFIDMENMFELLNEDQEVIDAPGALEMDVKRGALEFNNVSFSYVPERIVLRNITFTVPPGKTVALVGLFAFSSCDQLNKIVWLSGWTIGGWKKHNHPTAFPLLRRRLRRNHHRRTEHQNGAAKVPAKIHGRSSSGHGAVQQYNQVC